MATPRSRAREIAIQMSGLVTLFLSGKVEEGELAARLRNLAERIEGTKVLQPKPKDDTEGKRIAAELFAYWQRRMVKPRARLTGGRVSHVLARLRDGYTQEQMKQAIDACAASDFHMGENDRNTQYNGLEFIVRNGETLEKFIEMRKTQDHTHEQTPELTRLQAEAGDALQRGDMDAYNHANARIRDEQHS